MTALATFSGSLVSAGRAVGDQAMSKGTCSVAQGQSLVLAQHLSGFKIQFSKAVADLCHEFRSRQYVECFFQRLEVVNADHDCGGPAVLGDNHTSMLTLDLVHDLGQAIFHVLERHLGLDRHGYECSYTREQSAS